jgi:hypothetical protein
MELIEQGPEHLLDWIAIAQSNQDRAPHAMNWWLGLAEAAALNATTDDDAPSNQDVLRWAHAAIEVYNYLSETVAPEGRNGFECSAMFLRASMMERYGVIPDHPILDPYVVKNWFYDRLPLPREAVVKNAKHWQDLPIEQIRQLRHLKNRLSVIEFFVEKGYLQDTELREWVQIRGVLP